MKNTGTDFETTLQGVMDAYKRLGKLRMVKAAPPIRVFGPPGRQRVIMLPNPFLDFVGTWVERGGRMVMIEAKRTREARLPLSDSGLKESQRAAMLNWTVSGAVSFVLWNHDTGNGLGNTYFVPWAAIQKCLQLQERKSLTPEDCILLPQGNGFVLIDFLPEMHRQFPA